MRLEFESNTSAFPLVETDTVNEFAPSEGEQILRAGVKAAQEGRRSEAKALLMRVTEVEPENENAWLWLASISEYPEELLVFLNNVLRVNPENARAIEWKKATKSLLAKTLVQRGVDASKEDRKHFARQCFEQAIDHDSENELAWLWLASVVESESEKAQIFEKVLSINPENETALESVRSFHAERAAEVLREAVREAIEGHHSAAQQMLAIVLDENDSLEDAWVLKAHLATSFEERAESLLKIRTLNPENEMARACLASWRSMVENSDTSKFSDVESDAPETFLAREECPQAEVDASENVEQFDDAHTSFENGLDSEPEEVSESFGAVEEYAAPDSPTQDLNSIPSFVYQPVESLDDESNDSKSEDKGFAIAGPDFENGLAAEIEAEETEMSAAFDALLRTSSPDRESAADVAVNPDSGFDSYSDDQAMQEVPKDEAEWKNTSPEVFVGYVPKAPIEQSNEALSANDGDQPFEQFSPAPEDHFESAPVAADEDPRFEYVAEMPNFEETPEPTYFEETPEPAYFHQAPESAFSEPTRQKDWETYESESVAEPMSFDAPETTVSEPEAPMPEPIVEVKNELALCPFCNSENEKLSFSCASCHALLSLTDLESVFNHNEINQEIIAQAVASFEREHESYGLNADQLASLGIGHVNLKNYRQGYMYLQEAVQANPSNVVLDAQVNSFAIRLAELEKQQSAQESMSKNRRILVVDDSPTVRKLISSKLEKCGHEVVCAIDGLDALEKLNGLTPDLILLDITMPRMDGYQVCKLIRNNAEMKDVPVVMISGKDGFFDKVRGRMAGTTDYITKPFGPETLMKTVENYLS